MKKILTLSSFLMLFQLSAFAEVTYSDLSVTNVTTRTNGLVMYTIKGESLNTPFIWLSVSDNYENSTVKHAMLLSNLNHPEKNKLSITLVDRSSVNNREMIVANSRVKIELERQ